MTLTNYSRRRFGKIMLSTAPLALSFAKNQSGGGDVRLGVCTYSFRDIPRKAGDAIEPVISALKQCNANICELFSPQVEPENVLFNRLLREATTPGPDGKVPTMEQMSAKYHAAMTGPKAAQYRERLRAWRLHTPMDHFTAIRKQFDDAGIEIFAYTLNFSKDFTDEELDKCFAQAKALRVKAIASSTQVSMLERLKPLAEKHRIYVALHGHSDTRHPDEFSSPESFQKALDMSDWFRVNLDIGHFSAAGFDPVAYIDAHHDRITHLHIKDRKSNDGPNAPFGQGNTPIGPVLLLLKEKKFNLPAMVEYEYHGAGTPVEEVNKCLAYMRGILQKES